jgi:hypothetical protein
MTERSKQKTEPRRLKRLPPSHPAARDEGPRLIPLRDPHIDSWPLEHYLKLADSALKPKKPAKASD